MKAGGIETLIAGAAGRSSHNAATTTSMTVPHRLVPMHGVKATQQMLVQPLAGDRHSTRRVEPVFDFGIADERGQGRRPEVVIGCG